MQGDMQMNLQYSCMSWEEWKVINEEIIQVIREIHPKSVIGVAVFNWAYDLTPVGDAPIDASAIVYISHPYPEKRDAPWQEKWEAAWEYTPTRQGAFFKRVMSKE